MIKLQEVGSHAADDDTDNPHSETALNEVSAMLTTVARVETQLQQDNPTLHGKPLRAAAVTDLRDHLIPECVLQLMPDKPEVSGHPAIWSRLCAWSSWGRC
jgi:hypothetical protein